jgi:hypothetical protein
MGIATGIKGRARWKSLQLHRLLEFEKVWDDYLTGRATAAQVRDRAKKMLAVGLPRLR